jgi:hypothetical protein
MVPCLKPTQIMSIVPQTTFAWSSFSSSPLVIQLDSAQMPGFTELRYDLHSQFGEQ